MGRTKKVPKKELRKILEKENAKLEEDAKKILNEMATVRHKLSNLTSLLTKHATPPDGCQADNTLKKELLKLHRLSVLYNGCEDPGQETVVQQHESFQDTQGALTAQDPAITTPTDPALEEFMSSFTTDTDHIHDAEMTEDFARQWPLLKSDDIAEEAQDHAYIPPTEGNDIAKPCETKSQETECYEIVPVDLRAVEIEPELPDILDLKSEFRNSALPLQRRKLPDLQDFKVQLKRPSLLHNSPFPNDNEASLVMGETNTTQDQLSENNPSKTTIDINLQHQEYGLPLSFPASDLNNTAQGNIFDIKKQNGGNVVVESNKKFQEACDFDQIISCSEDIFTKMDSAKEEDKVGYFEPTEEDISDFVDLGQAKRNLVLKEEMHKLYVRTGLSPGSDLLASLIPTETADQSGTQNESCHDKFLKFATGDLNTQCSSPVDIFYSPLVKDLDFYTQGFEDLIF